MSKCRLPGRSAPEFLALDEFTRGYVEALFFTENEPGTSREERVTRSGKVRKVWAKRVVEGQQKDIPGDCGFADLDPESLARIVEDCRQFQEAHAAFLERAYKELHDGSTYDEQNAGIDFWYTRNGHGVGFWDRGLGEIGDVLANAARKYRELYVYMGDNGKIYVH